MAITARNKKIVVDEMTKFDKGEIEFLFETIKEAMIPGKYLPIAMQVVTKLKNQYKLLDKQDIILKSKDCLLYTSPSPRDVEESRMPSSA